jgi:hypothetical protein
MRVVITSLVVAVMAFACSNEPAKDADPCARATANARRLAADEPGTAAKYGSEPLTLERCRAIASREEVKCLGYASSWDELAACSPGVLQLRDDVARTQ